MAKLDDGENLALSRESEPPMFRLKHYLAERLDRPWAWMLVFGVAGMIVGTMIVLDDYPVSHLPVGWLVGFLGGAMVGLVLGLLVCLVCWAIGGLDREVSRPDRWNVNRRCHSCGWRSRPDDPVRRRDGLALYWRETCPECGEPAEMVIPNCPRCDETKLKGESILRDVAAQFRRPRTLEQALWGSHRCSECGCDYDRWGRAMDEAP